MAQRRRKFIPRRDTAPEHRINGFIRVPKVRLVGDNLEEVSAEIGQEIVSDVYATSQLRRWADSLGLDLIEIAPNAVPPVVRIADYKKFLYQKKRREKEIKSKAAKQSMKEIRFGPETAEHDYEFKMRHARAFLTEGSKVKAYVHFRGRAIVFKDRGELLLLRFMKDLEEVGAADQLPKMEGRRMIVILSPTKKPVVKKSKKDKDEKGKSSKKASAETEVLDKVDTFVIDENYDGDADLGDDEEE